ncbi:MAG: hypothetical protein ACWGPN_11510, partial [Gammaproteobacteria bacterium]
SVPPLASHPPSALTASTVMPDREPSIHETGCPESMSQTPSVLVVSVEPGAGGVVASVRMCSVP